MLSSRAVLYGVHCSSLARMLPLHELLVAWLSLSRKVLPLGGPLKLGQADELTWAPGDKDIPASLPMNYHYHLPLLFKSGEKR